MIICICQAITSDDIVKALAEDKLEELLSQVESKKVCGSCVPDMLLIIQNIRDHDEHLCEDA